MTEQVDTAWLDVARNAGRQDRDHEIRALEAEVERLKREWTSLYGVERMRFMAVQQLSQELAQAKSDIDWLFDRRRRDRAEIDRLRALLKDGGQDAGAALSVGS